MWSCQINVVSKKYNTCLQNVMKWKYTVAENWKKKKKKKSSNARVSYLSKVVTFHHCLKAQMNSHEAQAVLKWPEFNVKCLIITGKRKQKDCNERVWDKDRGVSVTSTNAVRWYLSKEASSHRRWTSREKPRQCLTYFPESSKQISVCPSEWP